MCARAHVCTFQSHVGYTRMECLCQRLEIYRRSLLLRHCRLLWKKIIEKLCFSSFPPYIKGYFRKFVGMDISLSTDFCKSKKKFTMMKFQRKFESQNLSPLGIKKKKKYAVQLCKAVILWQLNWLSTLVRLAILICFFGKVNVYRLPPASLVFLKRNTII